MKKLNDLHLREEREREHFNKMFKIYDEKYTYHDLFTQYKINKKFLEFLKIIQKYYPAKKLTIAEFGCGTGEYTQRIAKFIPNAKIIGIDIAEKVLDVAKNKCKGFKNVSFLRKSVYRTGIKNSSVDIVVGFYALHHFDTQKTYQEINRILKKGGLVFFYEPNIINPLVYIIKSSKFLKEKVGDTPNEWAINPFTIAKIFKGYEVIRLNSSEFIWPLRFIPFTLLKFLDKSTFVLGFIPGINFLGGSLVLCLRK